MTTTPWTQLVEFARGYLDPNADAPDDPYGLLESVADWIVELDDDAKPPVDDAPTTAPPGGIAPLPPRPVTVVRATTGARAGKRGYVLAQLPHASLYLVTFDDVFALDEHVHDVRSEWLRRDEFELA